MATPPLARTAPPHPHPHGHERIDPWYWLRDREDPDVLAYLRGRERLHRGGPGPPRRPADHALRGDEGPHPRDRHVGARRAGALVVLRAHRRGEELRHPLPPPGRRAGTSSRRPARPGPTSRSCWTRTSWPRGTTTSPSARPPSAPTTPGWPTPPTPRATSATSSTSATLDDATALAEADARSCADTGYGLAWSTDSTVVFYVRFDEAAPPPAVAAPTGSRPRR